MIWARMLAYITGTVDQELLLRNEYLAAENRILRAQIKGRLLLCDAEKATLAEIAHRLGRKALEELAAVARPDTLLTWYRKLIASKFDGSKFRKSRVVPEWTRKPSGWWCGWRRRIPGGAMTGSWAPWPTWVCGSL
jgi:putative transposase